MYKAIGLLHQFVYVLLDYTKPVDSVLCALWLATQTSICYLLPGIVLDSRASFSLILREKGTIWYRLCTDLVYNKTVIHLSDVSVKSRRYLPRREISIIIIQQIVIMPIYGKEALNICHPYMTDILRYA